MSSNSGMKEIKDLTKKNFEIVVARYNENMEWTRKYNGLCTIYNKGVDVEGYDTHSLPNIGRESHTYLYHIVNNYEKLADRTLFILGDWHDNLQYLLSPNLYCYYYLPFTFNSCGPFETKLNYDSQIAHYGRWLEAINNGKMKKYEGNFGDWWDNVLQINRKDRIFVQWSAIFSVPADVIRSKPKEYYEHLLSQTGDHDNPEQAHYFERSWY